MKWIHVAEDYLDYLRSIENRIPLTDYSSVDTPTAKLMGFLFLPLLHWLIPYGIAMSYTVSTS